MESLQTLFVSSVQKEFAEERRAVKAFVEGDPLLRRYFKVFLFEDLSVADRRADEVYVEGVDRCAVYVGLFGREYGGQDTADTSPTEQEYDRATVRRKPRLVFVKNAAEESRHPKMRALIRRAGSELIRRRFSSLSELTAALYAGLVEHLARTGRLRTKPFDASFCPESTFGAVSARGGTIRPNSSPLSSVHPAGGGPRGPRGSVIDGDVDAEGGRLESPKWSTAIERDGLQGPNGQFQKGARETSFSPSDGDDHPPKTHEPTTAVSNHQKRAAVIGPLPRGEGKNPMMAKRRTTRVSHSASPTTGQKKTSVISSSRGGVSHYGRLIGSIQVLLEDARRSAVRAVNGMLVATYWEIGRRIVEYDQSGNRRAAYGEGLVKRLSRDLAFLGRGFSERNLEQMRAFHLQWPISQTPSAKSGTHGFKMLAEQLRLSWSHYVRLLNVKNENARRFYEVECLRGGWSIRQLERQIDSQFYERTAMSRNKVAQLTKNQREESPLSPEQEIKDPYVLEFLCLKDEYSENQLEEALIRHLESFLLELGADFTFVARQKRMRVGDEWYRVDLLFYHRRLRCLVLIDLKLGKFTHADAGQMHMYLNYAKAHWTHPGENPPVGLILCAQKDESVAKYSLEDLPNKVLAAEYKTVLPEEKAIVQELNRTHVSLLGRWAKKKKSQ